MARHKTEIKVATPEKAIFCSRFISEIITRRKKKKKTNDVILNNLNNHQCKIKFTIEMNPTFA